MNYGIISRNVGIALICNAIFMFLSAVVSALDGFDSSFSPLLFSSILTAVFGIFPIFFVKRKTDINTKEGLAILLLAWLLCCVFGMIPYILWGGEFDVANAWFESASGITTTGATILNDIEALPKGLLFWRSSSHYIGGLGVVVFIMLILPSIGTVKFKMSKMEVADVSRSGYKYKANELIRVVFTVYFSLTIVTVIALMLAGMDLFDAVNHAFSAVATGGFSTRNLSIGAYNSRAIEIIMMLAMLISSLHYGLIYASFATRTPKVLKNPITKFYLKTILVSTIFIVISLVGSGQYRFWDALHQGLFAEISYITTTGFAIADTSVWPTFAILILVYASIQCGCSGSTSSGLRTDRVWIIYNAAKVQLIRIAHPNAVVKIKADGEVIDNDLITSVSMFTLLYLFIIFICGIIYSAFGLNIEDALSSSVALMGNIGPGFGSVGSMSNYDAVPAAAKIIMGFQMIIGRLGIYSVLLIFILFRRNN